MRLISIVQLLFYNSRLDRIIKCHRVLVGEKLSSILQILSHKQNVASLWLLYQYLHGQCLHILVPPVITFMANTRHATHILANHFLNIPLGIN